MDGKRMPAIFAGHGDPMIALRDDGLTRGMRDVGRRVLERCGKPKAILAVSAHWYTEGTFVQTAERPRQIYDMYGFPRELYEVSYPVGGCAALSDDVRALLGADVSVEDGWGIDHGSWTVLVHMFPKADIPVVQLSVDMFGAPERHYGLGRKLAPLRDAGYLVLGSGNIVHNLRMVDWENPGGSPEAEAFNRTVVGKVRERDDAALMGYTALPSAPYAVPTPDHYLPLLYVLGASEGEKPLVFNDACNLSAIAMTGFAFGLDG